MGRKKRRFFLAALAEKSNVAVSVVEPAPEVQVAAEPVEEVVAEVEVSAPVEEPVVVAKPKVVKTTKAK
jgi:hypothetical protein